MSPQIILVSPEPSPAGTGMARDMPSEDPALTSLPRETTRVELPNLAKCHTKNCVGAASSVSLSYAEFFQGAHGELEKEMQGPCLC